MKEFIMVRPTKNGNTLQELEELATLPEFNGNQSEAVREAIHEKRILEHKRIICVQHSGGRVEIDPSAK